MEPQDGEPTENPDVENGSLEQWLKPRADTGVAWCMRFLVLFAVIVILAELGLLIYLGVLNQTVLFKFNESAVPLQPFAWTGSQLPMNLSFTNSVAATYRFTLSISDDLNTFTGSMSLNFQTTAIQKGIVLHGKGLQITSAQLGTLPTGSSQFAYQNSKTIDYDAVREYIFLTFPASVPIGQIELKLEWSGAVSSGTEGLYKSTYIDQATGTTKTLLATQFEPNFARRVFPCFDEPLYRSKYDLSILVPNSFTTSAPLANTVVVQDSTINNGVNTTWTFSENVKPYPPYLVAFVIGDLVPTATLTTSGSGISIRVWVSRPDQVAAAEFALNRAKDYVEFFALSTRLATTYAFSKMDLVALPDFAEGAMENPGLLVFRDTALLVDNSATPSFASSMKVAEIVAHEVAHQWFGNLITPYYWNDLWVAEGSATYFSYRAVDLAGGAAPLGWNYFDTFFFAEEVLPALNADELLATSPVYHNVSTPAQARGAFDISSYSKGGSIIRHLNNQLSDTTTALWSNLRSAFSQSVGSMTSSQYLDSLTTTSTNSENSLGDQNSAYIFKPTMPVLNIVMNTTLTATMVSYSNFYNHVYNDTTASWLVPLKFQTPTGLISLPSLTASSRSATLATLPAGWYKANPDGVSYYRTQYPISNWQNLIAALNAGTATSLTANDKAGLISDAFSWAEIGQLPYDIVIGLLNSILKVSETNYVVWKTALSELQTLRGLVQDGSCDGNFDSMVKSWVLPASEYWSWNVDSVVPDYANAPNDTMPSTPTASSVTLRNLILGVGGEYINNHYSSYEEVTEYIRTPQQAFDAYMATPSIPLPVNTAATILKTVMLHAPWQTWDKVYAKYLATVEVVEKNRLLTALGWTAERSKAMSLLKSMATSSSVVRSQDHITVLRAVAANPEVGPDAIWEIFQDNSATIMTKFPQNFGTWVSALSGLNRAAAVSAFFTTKYPDMDISSVLEIINDNADWISTYQSDFCSIVQPLFPNKRGFTL